MTEAEWLTGTEVNAMLSLLKRVGRGSGRGLRLFACACCRRVWHLLSDGRNRHAVELAESFVDGITNERELDKAREASYSVYANTSAPESGFADAAKGISRASWEAAPAATATALAYTTPGDAVWNAGVAAEQSAVAVGCSARADLPVGLIADFIARAADTNERAAQADLLRCIFGNPFRLAEVESAWIRWNNGTVRHFAQAIYDERAFLQMPLLGDALEDAGCTDPAILDHCRGPGPHVRGCWVVDLLLGRK